jgi:8-oxo-dGTP pyrophosphatase MutT (NUDIX family)
MSLEISLRTITKVTSFVTRETEPSGTSELLVFRHPDAGVQLPAGSVEPGEAFEAAALREVEEETGLMDARLVARLGTRVTELGSMKAFYEDAILRKGPSEEAEILDQVPRGWWCRIQGEQGEYSEICYEELNRYTDPQLVIVRFSGWVKSASLAHRMERGFFHIRATGATPDRWVKRAEDRFDFECFWLPLVPKPDIQSPQQEWIEEHYEALVRSVESVGKA